MGKKIFTRCRFAPSSVAPLFLSSLFAFQQRRRKSELAKGCLDAVCAIIFTQQLQRRSFTDRDSTKIIQADENAGEY